MRASTRYTRTIRDVADAARLANTLGDGLVEAVHQGHRIEVSIEALRNPDTATITIQFNGGVPEGFRA